MKPGGVAIGCTDSALYRGPGIQGPNRLGRNFFTPLKIHTMTSHRDYSCCTAPESRMHTSSTFRRTKFEFFSGALADPIPTGDRDTRSQNSFPSRLQRLQFDRSPCSCDVFLCYVHFGIRLFLASVLPVPTNEAVHRPPPPKEPSYATDGTDCLLM